MNIKELMAKRDELVKSLKAATTMEEVEAIKKELDEVTAGIDVANAKAGMLENLGGHKSVEVSGAKSLGSHFAKFAEGKMKKGTSFSVTAPVFDVKAPDVHVTPIGAGTYADALNNIDPEIINAHRERLFLGDLFSQAPVTWFVEDPAIDGDWAAVGENALKPFVQFADPVEHSDTLKKIAGYYKVSDEVLEDAPRLAAHIDGKAIYRHDTTVDGQLLNGNGTGGNMRGVLQTRGIQSLTYAAADGITPDIMLDAVDAVENATDFEADAIVMNRTDYNTLLKLKGGNGLYLAGGPFGDFLRKPPIWGVPVYTTSKMAAGTVLVGAFRQGGTLFRKNGLQVTVFNQNENDAIYNRVTIVVESRELLAIEHPAAFVKISSI